MYLLYNFFSYFMSFYKENRNCPGISILHWTDKHDKQTPRCGQAKYVYKDEIPHPHTHFPHSFEPKFVFRFILYSNLNE